MCVHIVRLQYVNVDIKKQKRKCNYIHVCDKTYNWLKISKLVDSINVKVAYYGIKR